MSDCEQLLCFYVASIGYSQALNTVHYLAINSTLIQYVQISHGRYFFNPAYQELQLKFLELSHRTVLTVFTDTVGDFTF